MTDTKFASGRKSVQHDGIVTVYGGATVQTIALERVTERGAVLSLTIQERDAPPAVMYRAVRSISPSHTGIYANRDTALASIAMPGHAVSYPEHEKQALVLDKARAVGEFYDWLQENGIHLARFDRWGEAMSAPNIQQLLAEWLDIDLARIEAEKRAMLETMRARNEG